MRSQIDAIVKSAGLVPAQMTAIDNACPTDATTAGVSSTEASKEKLEWRSMLHTYIRKCRLGGAMPHCLGPPEANSIGSWLRCGRA